MKNDGEHWSRQEEATKSDFPMMFLICLVKLLPFPLLVCFVPFVSFFYYLFSPHARREAVRYQRQLISFSGGRHLQRPNAYAQMTSFALSLVEKVSAWSGKASLENVVFHDDDVVELKERLSEGKGAVLICSHLGNMELLRCLASYGNTGVDRKVPVTAIMDMQVSSHFSRSIARLNDRYQMNIIASSDVGVESLDPLLTTIQSGGLVVIAGDRTSASCPGRSIKASFLGRTAPFPYGSFLLSSLLGAPVYFVFALRQKGTAFRPRYDMFVNKPDVSFACSRKERKLRIQELCRKYAGLLESHCLDRPYQWYNFFDFWLFTEGEDSDGQKDLD